MTDLSDSEEYVSSSVCLVRAKKSTEWQRWTSTMRKARAKRPMKEPIGVTLSRGEFASHILVDSGYSLFRSVIHVIEMIE